MSRFANVSHFFFVTIRDLFFSLRERDLLNYSAVSSVSLGLILVFASCLFVGDEPKNAVHGTLMRNRGKYTWYQ